MSVDLTRFHDVFFEESYEAVNTIETGFLELDLDHIDPESINTIFRAAHSIKGGSATFGFNQIASFTHVLESLLDDIREGKRRLDQAAVDIMLGSVDGLREMLTAAQAGDQLGEQEFAAYKETLDSLLEQASGGLTTQDGQLPDSADVQEVAADTKQSAAEIANELDQATITGEEEVPCGWRIIFTPHREMMLRGNDPLRLIRELASLAPAKSRVIGT